MLAIPEIVLLLDDAETIRALRISGEELEWLVSSGTLPPIYIHAKRRFVLKDVQALDKSVRNQIDS